MSTAYATRNVDGPRRLPILNAQPWMGRATCGTLPPAVADAMFFRDSGGVTTPAEQAAVRMCNGCPVQAECVVFGAGEEHGIWGGSTPRERERWRDAAGAA